MMRWIKQLLCKHDWKIYVVNEPGGFKSLRGEKRVLACPKCKKVKKGSEHIAEYEGMGFK